MESGLKNIDSQEIGLNVAKKEKKDSAALGIENLCIPPSVFVNMHKTVCHKIVKYTDMHSSL